MLADFSMKIHRKQCAILVLATTVVRKEVKIIGTMITWSLYVFPYTGYGLLYIIGSSFAYTLVPHVAVPCFVTRSNTVILYVESFCRPGADQSRQHLFFPLFSPTASPRPFFAALISYLSNEFPSSLPTQHEEQTGSVSEVDVGDGPQEPTGIDCGYKMSDEQQTGSRHGPVWQGITRWSWNDHVQLSIVILTTYQWHWMASYVLM